MTKYRWCSVNAHFCDGAGNVSRSPFPIEAANKTFMTICNLLPYRLSKIPDQESLTLVLATCLGNPPAVLVWTAKTGRFSSRPRRKLEPLTPGGPNPEPYPSTRGFCRVWLDTSVPICGSAFRVSHLWSHSDLLLLIVKCWHWYVTVHFQHICRLDVQNNHTYTPNHILKIWVSRASTIFGLASSVIWVGLDHTQP
jgi:hypothetical protein